MKANEAPEKIYIPRLIRDEKLIHEWNNVPFKKFRFFFDKEIAENIEYTRTDAFIEKACDYLQKNLWRIIDEEPEFRQRFVTDFKNYMKGE